MGLDNGFVLRRRSDPNFSLELACFRKFYELDECLASANDVVEVSEEKLESLINSLQPVIDALRIYTDSELNYLEDNEKWPESLARKLYGNPFSPTTRDTVDTWRKAYKTRKLYMNLVTIRDMMSELCWTEEAKKDYYIEFYSSY